MVAQSNNSSLCLLGESVPGNETTAVPEKRADATNLAAAIGMRTITENAAGNGTATARGTATETVRERGKGSTGTARRQGRSVQLFLNFSVTCALLSPTVLCFGSGLSQSSSGSNNKTTWQKKKTPV